MPNQKKKHRYPCIECKLHYNNIIILSFTENFERSDFTPIEEARFFAKALNFDFSKFTKIPHEHSDGIKKLAEEIPSTPSKIESRLCLLTLPEKVQNMVEVKPKDGGLGVLVVDSYQLAFYLLVFFLLLR